MNKDKELPSNSSISKRQLVGSVISNKMDKTIVVRIERKVQHPVYKKYIRRFSKLYTHDERNLAKIGDLVEIQFGSRPRSKTKRCELLTILKSETIQEELTDS